jgi:hypothetical protein
MRTVVRPISSPTGVAVGGVEKIVNRSAAFLGPVRFPARGGRLGVSAFFAMAVIQVAASGCSDDKFFSYKTAAQAREAGEFRRGWLPEELSQAEMIFLCENLDTRETWTRFRIPPRARGALATNLAPSDTNTWTMRKPVDMRCWNEGLVGSFDAGVLRRLGFSEYSIPAGGPGYMALGDGEEGLFWRSR